jgi:hypothetical protein
MKNLDQDSRCAGRAPLKYLERHHCTKLPTTFSIDFTYGTTFISKYFSGLGDEIRNWTDETSILYAHFIYIMQKRIMEPLNVSLFKFESTVRGFLDVSGLYRYA